MGKHLLSRVRSRRFLVFAVLWFLCLNAAMPWRAAWGLGLGDEKELGRKILGQIRAHIPLVEDPAIVGYIQSVGNRIVKQVGITSYDYQFYVVNLSIPNAFAVPGGYIFIFRGLIELMSSEGELAAILSHEMAHIQCRHIHRQMDAGKVLTGAALAGVLAGVLLGAAGGAGASTPALAMGSMAGSQVVGLQYSREFEEEADQLGLSYLTSAGYVPQDMVTVLSRLNDVKLRTNSRIPPYLSTHPDTGDRVQYLMDLSRKYPKKVGSRPLKENPTHFQLMQAGLIAEYGDSKVARDRFDRTNPGVADLYGLGRLYLRLGRIEEALSYLLDAARREPGNPFILNTLGFAYFQQGKLKEAQRVLQTCLNLEPSNSMARYQLALVLQDQGLREEAVDQLLKIEPMSATFPEIDHRLGVLLGQVNQVGQAHYHLGRYYESKQDFKVALFHYEKARAMLKDSPQKIEELNERIKEVKQSGKGSSGKRERKR
ncbi:MAG: M48 family metalloprotease [Syntrophobacteraceae bacterium]|nr:M48 family metalloprotease [Syntrophobacteraceae bacterium]